MSVCSVERLPHEASESSWRTEIFEFLNEKLDQLETESSMDKIEDITGAIFQNKSEILRRITLWSDKEPVR